ncbi:MAG: Fe-S protein assembly co-chaperone HscB [Nitrospirota bacterium]
MARINQPSVTPPPPDSDYFACLGVPRRLQFDPEDLTERFHEQSRRVHPDFFQMKSAREQALSLEASALLNRAYRTLRDPIERMAYLIRLETGRQEIAAKAPDDLLAEIFELQEALEAYREGSAGSEKEAAGRQLTEEQARLRERLARLEEELQQLSAQWDDAAKNDSTAPERGALLAAMQERLAARKYFMNTLDDITLTLEGRSDAKDRRH